MSSSYRNRDSTRSRLVQCWNCFLKVLAFFFSHVGLFTLVFGYSVFGAFTFQALEADNELDHRKTMIQVRANVVESLWVETENSKVLIQNQWSEMALKELEKFEISLINSVKTDGYDGKDDTDPKTLQWNFFGALLYSIIVITTIGYGNIAPKTRYGKIVTIVYAIFGIPLMLIFLSNIGDTLAHSFKFLYWRVCCILCAKPRKKRHRRRRHYYSRRKYQKHDHIEQIAMQTQPTASDPFNPLQPPPPPQAFSKRIHRPTSYAANRQSSPRHADYSVICNKYAEWETLDDLAIPPNYSSNDYSSRPYSTLPPRFTMKVTPPVGNEVPTPPNMVQPQQLAPAAPFSDEFDDYDYSSEDDYSDSGKEDGNGSIPNVPITLCLILVVSYICGGALLFKFWEGWTFLDSCYFCFVTLTTIGFGDLVPGTAVFSQNDADAQTILGICAFYLLFGMALLAMSFNLVKEEATKSVRSIGKRIGIISDDDSESDFD